MCLNEALYVPKLNCNLLLVAKLCKDLNCVVTFFDESCVLQDHTSRTLIGVGEQRDGVYYYTGVPTMKKQASAIISRQLWHHRLGHPSNEVMATLFRNLGFFGDLKENKLDVCDVCFQAK